jgi:hypothetical protein
MFTPVISNGRSLSYINQWYAAELPALQATNYFGSRWTKLAALQPGFLGKTVDTSNPYDINFEDERTE